MEKDILQQIISLFNSVIKYPDVFINYPGIFFEGIYVILGKILNSSALTNILLFVIYIKMNKVTNTK